MLVIAMNTEITTKYCQIVTEILLLNSIFLINAFSQFANSHRFVIVFLLVLVIFVSIYVF